MRLGMRLIKNDAWVLALIYTSDIGTVYLYNIDILHNVFLTVHGTSTEEEK